MSEHGSAMGAPALVFRDIQFSYAGHTGGAPALDGATLEVAAGRITGLVGPNGCGKSTLLRAADALVAPSAGEVLVAGSGGELAPVADLTSTERAGAIALLMQIHRTPSMTVENLVMCGRYTHLGAFGRASARDRAIVEEAMDAAGVLALARKPARSLSGGERQRAFIAMALAQQARVLLLDEPTTFLDPRAARDVMALVARLVRERGLTVLAVLHDVDLALRTCEDIAVMEAGRVVDAGPARAVLARGAIQHVLGVEIERHDGPHGPSYAVF